MPKRTADEELYPVEIIVKARRTSESLRSDSNNPKSAGFGFGWEYNIKWEGYTDAENTWEPLENLRGCRSHILKFWSDAGFDSLLTNVPGFEVHAEWLQAQHSSSTPPQPSGSTTPKRTKQTRSESQSQSRKSPRRPAPRQPTAAHNTSLKIRIPTASSSVTQTPTKSTRDEPPIPTTPISPPLTPEPEPASDTHETQSVSYSSGTLDASDRLQTTSQTSPLFEPNSYPTPTFAPNDYLPPPSAPDVYLDSWMPAPGGLGVETTEYGSGDLDFVDYLADLPQDVV